MSNEARADGNDAARRELAALCGCDPGEVALCGGAQAAWTLARSRCRAAVFDNMMQSNQCEKQNLRRSRNLNGRLPVREPALGM